MAHLNWSWGDRFDSPTLVAAPQHPPTHQPMPSSQPASSNEPRIWSDYSFQPQLNHQAMAPHPQPQLQQQQHQQQHIFRPAAGRKRSRIEMSDSTDDSSFNRTALPSQINAAQTSNPGMPLPHLHNTAIIEAMIPSSQAQAQAQAPPAAATPGTTWAEDLADRMRSNSLEERSPPSLLPSTLEETDGPESRKKALRLDSDAVLTPSRPSSGDTSHTSHTHPTPSEQQQVMANAAVESPQIDIATRTLGIGWQTPPMDEIMRSATRGWARYIEHHYPLRSVEFVWANKGIPAYLVSAVTAQFPGSPGYYLFQEDLEKGRLVAKSWERALDNLRVLPMRFDGEMMEGMGSAMNMKSEGQDHVTDRAGGMELD